MLILLTAFLLVKVGQSNQEQNLSTENGYVVKAFFRQTEGITVGSKVRLAGIRIGYVKELSLRPDRNFSVDATMAIEKKIKIPSDSIASVQTGGILGEKFVEIEVGGDDVYLTDGGRFAYATEALRMDDLTEKVITLAKDSQKKMIEKKAMELLSSEKGK